MYEGSQAARVRPVHIEVASAKEQPDDLSTVTVDSRQQGRKAFGAQAVHICGVGAQQVFGLLNIFVSNCVEKVPGGCLSCATLYISAG